MSATLASNAWGEIIHHPNDGILELRWLPTKMTDAAFKATLALLALEAERVRPPFIARIGLRRATRRARRPNLCGFPNDSR